MKITPGIRVSLTMHGLPDGQVEVLCTAAARGDERLLARNIVKDSDAAVRACRDFLDARMDMRPKPPDPTLPSPDDEF